MAPDNQSQRDSRCSAILSISAKIGCALQTLNERAKKAEIRRSERAGVTTKTADRLRALEPENRELKQANEILREASACFTLAELDRRPKS